MKNPNIFISYSQEDGTRIAERIRDYLQTIGSDTWLYRFNKTNGLPTWQEIAGEIRKRDIAIVIITKGSHCSIGQERECGIINNYNKPVYLLKASDAEILPELSYANWEAFTDNNLRKLCKELPIKLNETIKKYKKRK